MTQILRTKRDVEQNLILESASDEAVLSDSESELDKDTVAVVDNGNVSRSQEKTS
jgi:hypothetical protein